MRVEWAKAQARLERWVEERDLLLEEMARTPLYLEWKAGWWEEHSHLRCNSDERLQEGCAAYAAKQADLCRTFARNFTSMWQPLLKKHSLQLPRPWPDTCVPLVPVSL
jgi:hypothetical protein